MRCDWCNAVNAEESANTVYWELPDGARAIEITETPCIICHTCNIEYQKDEVVEQIEDQLLLIDTKQLGETTTYHELMALPRRLKRNYFK